MPILKFSENEDGIFLDTFRLEDISQDNRTKMLSIESFIREEYKIDNKVYLVLNDMFFKMSKFFDKSKTPISAMLIKHEGNSIIIVPSRSYVFWKGKSVDPVEYKIRHSEFDIMKLLKVMA